MRFYLAVLELCLWCVGVVAAAVVGHWLAWG